MNQTSCGDDRDNAGPQRHVIVNQDDIGAIALSQDSAIDQTRRPGRRRPAPLLRWRLIAEPG